jgi:hypothetical protein
VLTSASRRRPWASALLILAAAGCGGDGGGTAPSAAVQAVSVDPTSPSVPVGGTLQLTATAWDESRAAVSAGAPFWASADSTIAAVSSTGLVTARRVGSVQIQAVVGGQSAYAFVTVVPRAVATVAVTPGTLALDAGATATLAAAATDDRGAPVADRPVTWASSDDAVAIVSSAGVVSAVAPGTATLSATVDGKVGRATVTVTRPVATRPTPDFLFACTNLICTFTDATTDAAGAVTAWQWDFGDGTNSPHRNSDNVFGAAGNYRVTLTVTTERGATGSVTKTVSPNLATPAVQLVNRATGRCLSVDVSGNADPRGASLVARPCDGRADQRYALPTGTGVGPLQLPRYSNRFVEMVETDGVPPRAWQWNGAQYQRWTHTPASELRGYVSSTCVTLQADGRTLRAESCRALDTQRWEVRP